MACFIASVQRRWQPSNKSEKLEVALNLRAAVSSSNWLNDAIVHVLTANSISGICMGHISWPSVLFKVASRSNESA